MQLRLTDLVHEETIRVGLKADSAEKAIRALVKPLVQTSRVQPAFAEDVWDREQNHPTGLPTEPLAVAIPHADPVHVLQSAVAIGILAKPVPFGLMGGTDGATVQARIIFLLAIRETEKQVNMIQELMRLLQAPHLLVRLAEADSPNTVRLVFMRGLASTEASPSSQPSAPWT